MTLGLQTRIALAQKLQAEATRDQAISKNIELAKRLAMINIMIKQFKVQCNSLPAGDPVGFAIGTMLEAFENICNGNTKRIISNEADAG